jgi:surface polysaccharide O-acyltransferase-like enzyme
VKAQPLHRSHVYELDPLRTVTAFSVVAVHVLAFTAYLNHSDVGTQIQNALVVALHYTREMFIFVTAFALVYVYYGKPFSLKKFWTKRSLGVVLPYCIWSIIYVWVNSPGLSPGALTRTAFLDILQGNASYQLYYILLTIQFYIILPLFLLFLKHVAQHPWKVLSVSFVLQVALLYVDYHWLQKGELASSGFWQVLSAYQDRFIVIYQFYFLLGGFTALYFEQVRTYLLRYGWIAACALVTSLAALWLHFVLQIRVYQEPMGYATSVLQPVMTFYCLPLIVCGLWIANLWAGRKNEEGRPHGSRIWRKLSDASFGVYLIHVLFLTAILKWVVPAMPATWPVALRVFLTWFTTVCSAAAASMIFMHLPILCHLVGRSYPPGRTNNGSSNRASHSRQAILSSNAHERKNMTQKESMNEATMQSSRESLFSHHGGGSQQPRQQEYQA